MNREQVKEAITKIRNCILNDKCELLDCGYYCALPYLEELIKYLDCVEEVIRCKRCKYYYKKESRCVLWSMHVNEHFFCWSGEKSEITGDE